jgi:hypothetical protein
MQARGSRFDTGAAATGDRVDLGVDLRLQLVDLGRAGTGLRRNGKRNESRLKKQAGNGLHCAILFPHPPSVPPFEDCAKRRGLQYDSNDRKGIRDLYVGDLMAGETGLEPATSGVTGRRSNQLSYSPADL